MNLSTQNFEFSTQGVDIKLILREDLMKAFIELKTNKENLNQTSKIDHEKLKIDVCAWIESQISEKLIDGKILDTAFEIFFKNGASPERKISQGIAAESGKDGKLLLLVKPFAKDFDGIYDFSNRYQKKYDSISKGAVIARIYEPKPGVDGIDILNHPIAHTPGIPVEIEFGDKLSLKNSDNHPFKEIVAEDNGYLQMLSENKIKNSFSLSLETILRINGDIDHKVGSLIFENEIEINGDVKEGFVVNARKDIKISGSVNHSNLISREGSIYISGIVLDEDVTDEGLLSYLEKGSENQHTINAHQKIVAGGLQNAQVFAGDTVEVNGSIVRSHVYSSSIVICKESVYASKISTACGIEANYFGNSSGVTTLIEFLNPIEAGIDYVRKKNILNKLEEKKVRLELFLGPFIKDNGSIKLMSAEHQKKIKVSLLTLKNILTEIETESKNLDALKVNAKNVKYSQLNAIKGCHQNLIVKAEESIYKIEEIKLESFSLQYDWETKNFTMSSLKTIQCELIN